jgi:hypothetical protein
MKTTLRDHVFSRLIIEPETGCLLWAGYISPNGYGNTGGRLVHRLMYEWFNGPIPDGLEIDHLCSVKHCAAPAHLEAVTHAENRRRAVDKPHCQRGHEWTQENTYRSPAGNRYCRQCQRAAYQAWIAARRSERPRDKGSSGKATP